GRAIGTAIFKRNVLAFQIAEIAQSLPESIPHRRIIDDADARNPSLLLRARRERPRDCPAAQQRDEIAASHVGHRRAPPALCQRRPWLYGWFAAHSGYHGADARSLGNT